MRPRSAGAGRRGIPACAGRRAAWWGAFALLCACASPAPPPPPTPADRALPEGCPDDLAGRWVLASDPSWSYRATDDGGTVVLDVERHWGDAGTPERASSARVVLRRTPGRLTGETRAPRMGPSGPGCEASGSSISTLPACGR